MSSPDPQGRSHSSPDPEKLRGSRRALALLAGLALVVSGLLVGAVLLLTDEWGAPQGDDQGAGGGDGSGAGKGRPSLRAPDDVPRFDRVGIANGELAPARAGGFARRAGYAGGGGNGYARGVFDVAWRPGATVVYRAEFRLPRGFARRLQGQVALLRWDNWPSHREGGDQGGIVVDPPQGRARLVWGRYHGAQRRLGPGFRLPEGRWFQLRVRQRLARGRPLSRVWLDGRRVAASRQPNFGGRPIERLRAGIVAVAAGSQLNPLRLSFRRVAFAPG